MPPQRPRWSGTGRRWPGTPRPFPFPWPLGHCPGPVHTPNQPPRPTCPPTAKVVPLSTITVGPFSAIGHTNCSRLFRCPLQLGSGPPRVQASPKPRRHTPAPAGASFGELRLISPTRPSPQRPLSRSGLPETRSPGHRRTRQRHGERSACTPVNRRSKCTLTHVTASRPPLGTAAPAASLGSPHLNENATGIESEAGHVLAGLTFLGKLGWGLPTERSFE